MITTPVECESTDSCSGHRWHMTGSRVPSDDRFDRWLRRARLAVDHGYADQAVVEAAAELAAGNPVAWASRWRRAGTEALDEADALLDADRMLEARERYLRACEYFGQAVAMSDAAADSDSEDDLFRHVIAFRTAMPLLPTGCAIVEPCWIPDFSGYFCWHRGAGPRPVVMATMSSGWSAETGCIHLAQDVVAEGMDCLVLNPLLAGLDEIGRSGTVLIAAITWLRSQRGIADRSAGLSRLSEYLAVESTTTHRPDRCPACNSVASRRPETAELAALGCLGRLLASKVLTSGGGVPRAPGADGRPG